MLLTKLLHDLANRVLGLKARTRRRTLRRNRQSSVRAIEALEDRTLLSVTATIPGNGNSVIFQSDSGTNHSIIFSIGSGGILQHNLGGLYGFNSSWDLDSTLPGDQIRLPSDITHLSYTDQDLLPDDSVEFDGNIFDFTNSGLDEVAIVAGTFRVANNGRLNTTAGSVNVTVSQNITLSPNSRITSTTGDIALSANQQSAPSAGTFTGIQLTNARLLSNTGSVTLQGRGGSTGTGNLGVSLNSGSVVFADGAQVTGVGGSGSDDVYGVLVDGGSTLSGTNNDPVIVKGMGGGNQSRNFGVFVRNSNIAASGALIHVIGEGSLTGTDSNFGVYVENDSSISSGTSSEIVVDGTAHGTGIDNVGVVVALGASISSNDGNLTVNGIGSTTGTDFNHGVAVRTLLSSISAGTGNVSVNATGNGSGSSNFGLWLGGEGFIASNGGNVQVTGIGGNGAGNDNIGVYIDSTGGEISTVGTGSVTVNGTGGSGPGNGNTGVVISGLLSQIVQLTGGDISVTGVSHGTGAGGDSYGVFVTAGGQIQTDTSGSINISGTGGQGTGANNVGVWLDQALISTFDGNLAITGTEGGGTSGLGLVLRTSGTMVQTLGSGVIQLTSDSMDLGAGTSINAGARSVSLRPKSDGHRINLGAVGNPIPGPLSLSDAELNRITAGTLVIGSPFAGDITISAPIVRPVSTDITLRSNDSVIFNGGQINTGGGTFTSFVGTLNDSLQPIQAGTDIIASTTLINGPLSIDVDGLTVDSEYTQLNVAGSLLLSSTPLELTGSIDFTTAGTVTIVTATSVQGTFTGLPDNSMVPLNGQLVRINYTLTSVILTIPLVNFPPVITSPSSVVWQENQPASAIVLQVEASDPNGPMDQLTYSLSGNDVQYFTIDSVTGAIRFLNSPDAENPLDEDADNRYEVRVQVTDNGAPSLVTFQDITIQVVSVNESPFDIVLTNDVISENTLPNATVGTLVTSDPDLGDSFQYTLVPGIGSADNANFTIIGSDLQMNVTPNFEIKSTYQIRVQTSDQNGVLFEKSLVITILDSNDSPVVTSQSVVSLPENQTDIITVTATDEDLPAQTLHYSISEGFDEQFFTIDPVTGLLSFLDAPDFEFPQDDNGDNVYSVFIVVSDGNGGVTFQQVAVTVLDTNDTSTQLSISNPTVVEGDDGSTIISFVVVSSGAIQSGFSVDYVVSLGTASGADLMPLSPSLTFTGIANESHEIRFQVTGDTSVEQNETFQVTLGTVTASTPDIAANIITGAVGTGTILNDDSTTLSLSGPVVMVESPINQTISLTVTSSNAVEGGFDVNVFTTNGTAGDDDYQLVTSTVHFNGLAGESQIIEITIIGDLIVEPAEFFKVSLGAVSGTTATQAASIVTGAFTRVDIDNLDTSELSITSPLITESNGDQLVTFLVTSQSAVAGGFDVAISATNGTASNDDFVLLTTTVHFNGTAGETQLVTVRILGDTIVEAPESFNVTLGAVSGTTPTQIAAIITGATATATINNDDNALLSIVAPVIIETNVDQTVQFVVTSDTAVEGGFHVDIQSLNGLASGSDYTLQTTQLQFTGTAGETQLISVVIKGDTRVEADETFQLVLGAISGTTLAQAGSIVTGASSTATIRNDDAGLLTISTPLITESNGDQTVLLTVTSSSAVEGGFDVALVASDGSAGAFDYQLNTTSVHFNGIAGETQLVSVTIRGDLVVEANETFQISLGAVSGTTPEQAAALTIGSATTATIFNDDAATLLISAPVITESNVDQIVTFLVTLPQAVQGGFDVALSSSFGTAGSSDYSLLTPLIHFNGAAGETQLVSVLIKGDTTVEENEAFRVSLEAVTGTTATQTSSINTGAVANATIVDDDSAVLSLVTPVINESNLDQTVIFLVTLSDTVEGGFDVLVNTLDGTANSSDYALLTTTLHFNGVAGETQSISVIIRGDMIVEAQESFQIALGTVSGTTAIQANSIVTPPPATATIGNDDTSVLSVLAPLITESNVDQTVAFTVTSSLAVEGGFDVLVNAIDGTASVSDYALLTTTLHFNGVAGETQSISVIIRGDTIVEAQESLQIALGTVSGTTAIQANSIVTPPPATATIGNDDTSVLSIIPLEITEANSDQTVKFAVTSSNDVAGGFDVAIDTTALTADSGDYALVTTTLHFNGFAAETQFITVTIRGDLVVEANETFRINLGTISGTASSLAASISSGASAVGSIFNDDEAVFTINDASSNEDSGLLMFSLVTDRALDQDMMLDVTFVSGTASNTLDYFEAPQQVLLAAGQTSVLITVGLVPDSIVELAESFSVILGTSTPLNGRKVDFTDQGIGTILNDDSLSIVSPDSIITPENQLTGNLILDVNVGPVEGPILTYQLSGPDAARFQIDNATGEIRFIASPDFELPTDVGTDNHYNVIVNVSGGNGLSASQAIEIQVLEVNDNAPVITSATTLGVYENSTSVLTVRASDADLPAQVITYQISGGTDAALFSIDPNTGLLKFRIAPNFEVPLDADVNNTYHVTVSANDGAGLITMQEIVVSIQNVDEPLVVNLPGPTLSYAPGSGPLVLDSDAAATDPDTTGYSFNGARLTVELSGINDPGDRLGLLSQGSGTGNLSILYGHMVYESSLVIIAKILRGLDGGPLELEFTSFATPAIVDKLLKIITYTASANPQPGVRTLTFQFTNLTGTAQEEIASKTINVNVQPTGPSLPGTSRTITYENGSAPATLLEEGLLPVEGVDLKYGRLTVSITSGLSRKNRLQILEREGIDIAGRNVLYQGRKIGKLSRQQNALRIDLTTEDATPTAVKSLLRTIAFSTKASNSNHADRVLEITLTDRRGQTTSARCKISLR